MKFVFSKTAIEALVSPSGKRVFHADAKVRGLQLIVQSSGHRSFYLYRKIRGRPERLLLGRYPDLSIEAARRMAEQLNARIAEGHDPSDERRREKTQETFGDLYTLYMDRHAKIRKRSWKSDEALWRLYLQPLAHLRLGELKRRHFAELHAEISKTRPTVANRVLALASSIFGRAFEWGIWENTNPCKGVRANREVPRARFLKGNELRRFLSAVDAEPCETSRDLILIALLTGARQGNVVKMRWEELDLEEAEWIIPSEKHKSGDAQIVPLAPEAVAILRRRFATTSSPWVFPALRADNANGFFRGIPNAWRRILLRTEAIGLAEMIANRRVVDVEDVKEEIWQRVSQGRSKHAMKRSRLSATDLVMAELRDEIRALGLDPELAKVRDLRMHDLRRTMASWQMKTGASLYIASQSLGHKDLKTTTTYARLDSAAVREAMERAGSAMLALRGRG
jgi:integrase